MARDNSKKIDPKSVSRAKEKPTTGDGRTGGRKPRMSETNLPGRDSTPQPGGRLRTGGWLPSLFKGRHRGE